MAGVAIENTRGLQLPGTEAQVGTISQSPSGFTASSYTGMGEFNTEHSQDNISDQGQNDHPDSANVENDDSDASNSDASDGAVNYNKICARSFLYELKY